MQSVPLMIFDPKVLFPNKNHSPWFLALSDSRAMGYVIIHLTAGDEPFELEQCLGMIIDIDLKIGIMASV